jgi:hypothetical protein
MAYTSTSTLAVIPFNYPRGVDNTQNCQYIRGNLVFSGGTGEYSVGGIGSTSFEVTDVTALGVVTYASLTGQPLHNGQTVVIVSTTTAGNSGNKTISAVTPSSATAGTFQINTFGAVHDATQTAEGVGSLQFGTIAQLAQTYTVASVVASVGTTAYTYTTLTGPQVQAAQTVTIAGMTNPGNNGTFRVKSVATTSITAGTITAYNSAGVSTDSGTGVGVVKVGSESIETSSAPTQVRIWSTTGSGYFYNWDSLNQTVQVLVTGTAATDPDLEAAVANTIAFDNLQFEAVFPRSATV